MVLSFDRWVGKTAIVTGASVGIGSAIVERLVKEGLQVVGIARRLERMEELSKKLQAKKGKLHPLRADLTNEEDILKAFKWTFDNVGPVHILVNNAGLTQNTNLTDGDSEKWKIIFDTNVLGLCIATREAVKIMKDNQINGHIVHINSMAGHRILKRPDLNVYPASKYAVTALTETLRQELNHSGNKIKVTSISPGVVSTEFILSVKPDQDPKEHYDKLPHLEAEDIADSVLYVLSTPPHVQVHELMIRPVGQPM